MVATTWEKRPAGFLAVPLNIRCSRKCASPDLPGVSSAEPTRYQSMWVTTGVRRSGITTTSRPFDRAKWVIWGPLASAPGAASATAVMASAVRLVRRYSKAAVPQYETACISAGELARARADGDGTDREPQAIRGDEAA